MRLLPLIFILFLTACGAGEGTNNDRESSSTESSNSTSSGSPTITITGGGENSVTTVNISDSADGQTNVSSSENAQDPITHSGMDTSDLSAHEKECARCCGPDNDISEASCVDEVEGENNVNGDCPSEVLVEAGCSPDLSAKGCFLCKSIGWE